MDIRAAKLVALSEYMDLVTGQLLDVKIIHEVSKQTKMSMLNWQVRHCHLCPELTSEFYDNNSIVGVGDPNAKLFIIKHISAADDCHLLEVALKLSGIYRDAIFVTHIIHCQPHPDQTPKLDEIRNCRKFLQRELNLVQPIMVAALGSEAAVAVASLKVAKGIKVLKVKSPAVYKYSSPESRVNWVVKFSLAIDKALEEAKK